jgi:DNA-binding LacI/PurR family transcriptional regulator
MNTLGYSPNTAARALRSGNFQMIGVIAHRLARTGEFRTIEAVADAAMRESYTVTLLDIETTSSTGLSAAVARLRHQAIDGLVIIRAEMDTPSKLVLPPDLPVVVSDSRFLGTKPAVGTDQVAAAAAAIDHLFSLGHRTIHHLAGPSDSDPAEMRVATWRRKLAEAGHNVPPLFRGDWSAASGYREGQRIAATKGVTAVFAANDEMAAGLMRALHEHGLDVPGDVSVVGVDGVDLAEYLWPPLTTVAQDFTMIGNELVALLLRQIREGVSAVDEQVKVPATLIQRSSTAPPNPARLLR